MPGMTPLGIVYPCGGDTIDTDVFIDYASSVQNAISNTQALADQSSRPPAASVRTDLAGQTIAAGVTSIITYAAAFTMYDTMAMFTDTTPTLITIQSPGSYLVNVWSTRESFPTDLFSHRVAIRLNAVEQAFHKQDGGGGGIDNASQPFFVSALLSGLIIGDLITTTHLFTGVGTMEVRHAVSVTKVSSS